MSKQVTTTSLGRLRMFNDPRTGMTQIKISAKIAENLKDVPVNGQTIQLAPHVALSKVKNHFGGACKKAYVLIGLEPFLINYAEKL